MAIQEYVNGNPQGERFFLWLGASILEERSGTDGGTVKKRFFAQGVEDDGQAYYYHRDHLGSIRQITDAAGSVVAEYDYSPYGVRTKIAGGYDADFGYTGHFQHEPTGLTLTFFRAYDPVNGVWLSRDPIGEAGGLNLYGYVGNNPINAWDPLGLKVFVQVHAVGSTGGYHLSLLIIPDDQSRDWSSQGFRRNGGGAWYMVMGAGNTDGSENTEIFNPVLEAGSFRERDDESATGKRPCAQVEAGRPPGGKGGPLSENEWIDRLVAAHSHYMSQPMLNYDFLPSPGSDGYNSNSYVAGLLEATGSTMPSLPTWVDVTGTNFSFGMPDWSDPLNQNGHKPYTPGIDNPVPPKCFGK